MDISLVNKIVSGYLLLKASLSDARPRKKKQLNLRGGKFTRKNRPQYCEVSNHLLRIVMEPKYYAEVIGHLNHNLSI